MLISVPKYLYISWALSDCLQRSVSLLLPIEVSELPNFLGLTVAPGPRSIAQDAALGPLVLSLLGCLFLCIHLDHFNKPTFLFPSGPVFDTFNLGRN